MTNTDWQANAGAILTEAVDTFEAGHLRSALHAAYDTVSYALEIGLETGFSSEGHSKRGRFFYQTGVFNVPHLDPKLRRTLSALGTYRGRTVHTPYNVPVSEEVRRFISATVLFMASLGVPISVHVGNFAVVSIPEEPSEETHLELSMA